MNTDKGLRQKTQDDVVPTGVSAARWRAAAHSGVGGEGGGNGGGEAGDFVEAGGGAA
jgi:hypothetical protein